MFDDVQYKAAYGFVWSVVSSINTIYCKTYLNVFTMYLNCAIPVTIISKKRRTKKDSNNNDNKTINKTNRKMK